MAALGGIYTSFRAQARLDDALDLKHHNFVTRLTLRVTSLPTGDVGLRRFDATVLPHELDESIPPLGFPSRIRVSWRAMPGAPPLPEILPGQVWRMALRLRRPHALRNPYASDNEARLFALGIRATGSVRGRPALLDDTPWHSIDVAAQRIRYRLRERMLTALADAPYAGVIVALALGDQSGIDRAQWEVFRRTGISHLVAISGMHVGLVAGLAAWLAGRVYRRVRWRGVCCAEYVPTQHVMMLASVGVAIVYCALSGWGIPARRVLLMLSVVAVAVCLRLPLSASRVLTLAAFVVVVIDPWAPLSMGFWLSFIAVTVLLALVNRSPNASIAAPKPRQAVLWREALALPKWFRRPESSSDDLYADSEPALSRSQAWQDLMLPCLQFLKSAGRVQFMLSVALIPATAALTGQVSLAGPLVNAFAIPLIALCATPLALLFALACLWPAWQFLAQGLGKLAHVPVAWAIDGAGAFAESEWAVWHVGAAPAAWVVLAGVGVGWGLMPIGLPGRRQAWILLLPLLVWRPPDLREGAWRLVALDVGQGGAAVVLTRSHVVVFDAGLRFDKGGDMGERVVAPYLRAMGRRGVDRLIVSHQHADHMGGVNGLMRDMPVIQADAPFDLNRQLQRDAYAHYAGRLPPGWPVDAKTCAAGDAWVFDGVRFSYAHPPTDHTYSRAQANASSCVLLVEGAYHRAVLPGDISSREERAIAAEVGSVDIALVAHHGSSTSSSYAWLDAIKPTHAIAQAGYLNRFGHPAEKVVERWLQTGVTFWRNDLDGAVEVLSNDQGLQVQAWRDRAIRYWHNDSRGN